MGSLSTEANNAADSVKALPSDQQKAVVQEIQRANPELFPKGDWQKTILWGALILALLVIGLTGIILGAGLSEDDKDATAYVAVGTLVVGGLIGLFSKSPVN